MKDPSPPPCAICGSAGDRVVGRCGVTCRQCLAAAAAGIIEGNTAVKGPMTASDLCALCGEAVVAQGKVAAFSGPYRICFVCVRDALELSNVFRKDAFSQIPIGRP